MCLQPEINLIIYATKLCKLHVSTLTCDLTHPPSMCNMQEILRSIWNNEIFYADSRFTKIENLL